MAYSVLAILAVLCCVGSLLIEKLWLRLIVFFAGLIAASYFGLMASPFA